MRKGINLIKSIEINKTSLSHHLELNKFRWEKIGLNVRLSSAHLKLDRSVSNPLIVAALDTWYKISPSSREDYNDGTITFGNGSLTHLKGKGSISILSYPKLHEFLNVDRLKANLLSINKICDNEHRVNFC